jgi:hypothetical protein
MFALFYCLEEISNYIIMKQLFTIAVFLTMVVCYSQDMITTKSGEDIKAKVLEITFHEVKYKKAENIEGPTYTISKSDILLIRYENGSKDIFNQEEMIEKKEIKNYITVLDKRYFFNGEPIKRKKIGEILYQDEQARKIYKKSQSYKTGAIIGGSIGVTLATLSLIQNIMNFGQESKMKMDKNIMDYAGFAIIIPSYFLRRKSNKLKIEAIETYNKNQMNKKITINPVIFSNGLGIAIHF